MRDTQSPAESGVYKQQGFGTPLPVQGNIGLLIVAFVVGCADPATFGGGNIAPAIERTVHLLAAARRHGWPVAHSRIVYAADGSDDNVFSLKVPGMATLTEDHPNSAIVPELTPARGELVVRKTVPSAFFGTQLAPWLSQRAVQTLIVAGAATRGWVRAIVVTAVSHAFRRLDVSDCVGDQALGPRGRILFAMLKNHAVLLTRDE